MSFLILCCIESGRSDKLSFPQFQALRRNYLKLLIQLDVFKCGFPWDQAKGFEGKDKFYVSKKPSSLPWACEMMLVYTQVSFKLGPSCS